MIHDIPAKSRLVPAIPITSPQFIYRRAKQTDVRLTFARARGGAEPAPETPFAAGRDARQTNLPGDRDGIV